MFVCSTERFHHSVDDSVLWQALPRWFALEWTSSLRLFTLVLHNFVINALKHTVISTSFAIHCIEGAHFCTSQYKKKVFYEFKPSETWFPTYSLLSTKENAPTVHLEHQHACHMSEQSQPVSLEISRCRMDRLKSIQCFCKSWMPLTSVAQTADCKCLQR
jgi:hypothetical protein